MFTKQLMTIFLFALIIIAPLKSNEKQNNVVLFRDVEIHFLSYSGNIVKYGINIDNPPTSDEIGSLHAVLVPDEKRFEDMISKLKERRKDINVREIISPLTGRRAIEITSGDYKGYTTVFDGVILWQRFSFGDKWISLDEFEQLIHGHKWKPLGRDIILEGFEKERPHTYVVPDDFDSYSNFLIFTAKGIKMKYYDGKKCEDVSCAELLRRNDYEIPRAIITGSVEITYIEGDLIIDNGDRTIFALSPNYYILRVLSSCLDKRSRLSDIVKTMDKIITNTDEHYSMIPSFSNKSYYFLDPLRIGEDASTLHLLINEAQSYKKWLLLTSNYIDRFEETRFHLYIYDPEWGGWNSFNYLPIEKDKIHDVLDKAIGKIPQDSLYRANNKIDLFEAELLKAQSFMDTELFRGTLILTSINAILTFVLLLCTLILIFLSIQQIRKKSKINSDIQNDRVTFEVGRKNNFTEKIRGVLRKKRS